MPLIRFLINPVDFALEGSEKLFINSQQLLLLKTKILEPS